MIPAGSAVEVDTEAAEARTVTVRGTLLASRTAPSRLSLFGNLIVADQGVLDYGTPGDRVLVPATIRWSLNEALYVGGHAMAPLPSDVGLWAIDQSQVWAHGRSRDAWAPLTETASAGAATIRVDPSYSSRWQVGDSLAFTPTNPRDSGGGQGQQQHERRRITAIFAPGHFQLDAPLQFTHIVNTVTWTDAWGDVWTETLAGKVGNLSSNLRLEAADPNNRPHVLFLDQAKFFVEDLEVANFSPTPTVGPMARYAWHAHMQDAGSRGSYLRRVSFHDGVGDAIHIHESWGIEMEDVVVYNHARIRTSTGRAVAPIMLERTEPHRYATLQRHAADGCWIDRPLVIGWGVPNDAFFMHGIWTTGSVDCAIVGAVAAGGSASLRSSGIHWDEGGAADGEVAHVYKVETFSNWRLGLHAWQNQTPRERVVDVLTWRNGDGVGWGAYGTTYWAFQVRAIENMVQLAHWAAGWGITGFLADGRNRPGSVGIEVRRYGQSSSQDSAYEDGVVRNVAVNARHEPRADPSNNVAWIQFARVRWQPGVGVTFTSGPHIPVLSHMRFRQQQGLDRAVNFTLWRLDDPSAPAGAIIDTAFNAKRLDNDTIATRPQPPRVRLVSPADDVIDADTVTLIAESNAAEVVFWQANHVLARVPVVNGRATFTFDMRQHPHRRAYFWAGAASNGAASTSRVIRVRKF